MKTKRKADVIILLKFNAKLRKTNFVCSIFEIQRGKKGKIKMKILSKETNLKNWFKKDETNFTFLDQLNYPLKTGGNPIKEIWPQNNNKLVLNYC